MPGCAALKERTGEYVTEAVVDHIAEKVDQRLERRGLSISQIQSITDLNDDGKVDLSEVRATATAAGREVALAESERWRRESRAEWDDATKKFITVDENTSVKGKIQDFWNWLIATFGLLVSTIVGYLTKQVFSAKTDGKRDAAIAKQEARTDALERLLGRDLDNDGMIGHNGSAVSEGHQHVVEG
jgi:DNA-binding transcriptional MerR regulator